MSSLPKKNDDGIAFISYSQMRTFKMCPKAYEYKYVEGIREPMPGRVKIGSAFDKAANAINEALISGSVPSVDIGVEAARAYMADPGEDFDETDIAGDDTIMDRVVESVSEYASTYAAHSHPLHVQHEINYNLKDDVILTGYVDLIELADGAPQITDIKTTLKKRSGKYTHDTATIDEQLTLYSATALPEPISNRGWVVVDVGRKSAGRIESVHVSDRKPDNTADLAIQNAEANLHMIESACASGLFAPLARGTWACSHKYCEYFNRCPYGSSSITTVPTGEF